ncbi:hypothetical protein [Ferdinandcohnia sp. Marseille-Q9671]
MKYMQIVSSAMEGLGNHKSLRTFTRKRSNTGWILISMIAVTIMGIIGGRNKNIGKKIQSGYTTVQQTVTNMKNDKNPVKNNLQFATEVSEEFNPDMLMFNNK